MTHAERIQQAIREVAATLPGFDQLNAATRQILLEVGEEYFRAEFVPRLEGIVNIPRYETAMHENTAEDRAFIEDQLDFLNASIAKAQAAAHDQLLQKSIPLLSRNKS